MSQIDVWCKQSCLARRTKRHNWNHIYHRIRIQYLVYLCRVRGWSSRHDHRVSWIPLTRIFNNALALTSSLSQWSLRWKSEQDLDSSARTSQQRYLRARAHFVRLHCKHIPGALRHGIVRLCRYIPLPLVRARHNTICCCPQRHHLRLGRPHIRNLQLSRTRKPTCNNMRADQEYSFVRDQFWYHAMAAV